MPLFPTKPNCPNALRIRVGGVYVRNSSILLVRHQKDGRSYWLLPGGGVEVGETMPQALEREAWEECGIVTRTQHLLFVSEAIEPTAARHLVNMTFLGEIREGEPVLRETDGRIVEVAFIPKDQLKNRLTIFPDFLGPLLEAWNSGFVGPSQYLGNLWRD